MNFDTIFFDVGNTLFFFNYDFLRDLLAERFGVRVMTEELEEKHLAMKRSLAVDGLLGRLSQEELWWEAYRRWIVSLGAPEGDVRAISEAIRNHPFRHLFWSRLEEGTTPMLDWFRERGFKLGIISNAEGQIRRLIEHVHLEDRFEAIVDSGEVGFSKPDERIFLHAVERLGAHPSRCIHVGDLFEVDVVGARAAGLTPVLVDREGFAEGLDCLRVRRAIELPGLPIFSPEDSKAAG